MEAWQYLTGEIRPDIALLQEVSPPKLDCSGLLFKKIRAGWGTAVYARSIPLEEIEVERYGGRIVAAKLALPNSRILYVVSIHTPIIRRIVFPHLCEIFDEVESMVHGRSFVVGGDLNTARLVEHVWPGRCHGPFFARLEKSIFFDCCRKFHEVEQQTYFRKNSKYSFQDNHLFVSKDLALDVLGCDVINNEATRRVTDHIPLFAEIST